MKRKEILDRMGLCLPPDKQIRVVISSDVSNEADDPFAIVHQLLTPIFDVRGVIATHYEGKTRGRPAVDGEQLPDADRPNGSHRDD